MEENKNLAPETAENVDTVDNNTANATPKENKKVKKVRKAKKVKKLKNQALLRKGGFSIAITAAVLAGIILFNVLVGALSDRFVLEFDMSAEKENSMSEENIDYIKGLETEIEIIVCATPDDYVEGYMDYYAQKLYSITGDATDYYKQTITLLDKYPAYNDKIILNYVDTQASEFTEISSKYSNESLSYGDIIVSCTENEH